MGWDFSHRDKGMANREWFSREFPSLEFLADATVGGTFYAAARHTDGSFPGEVFALVVPTQWVPNDYYNFGYKSMDETVGPNESKAPAKVLDLLTPTDSEWANQWRARCRANLAKKAEARKVKVGDTVRFAQAIEFTNGAKHDTFTFEGGSKFRAGYVRYHITAWRDRAFAVVGAAEAVSA